MDYQQKRADIHILTGYMGFSDTGNKNIENSRDSIATKHHTFLHSGYGHTGDLQSG